MSDGTKAPPRVRTPRDDAKRYLGMAPYHTAANKDRGSAAFAAECARIHGREVFHKAIAKVKP